MRRRGNASLMSAVMVLTFSIPLFVGVSLPAANAASMGEQGSRTFFHEGDPSARADAATGVLPAAHVLFGPGSRPRGVSEGAWSVRTGTVLAIGPAEDAPPRTCNFSIQVSGRYSKPDFTAVMREEGVVIGTSTCGADLIPFLQVDATIDDFGMPGAGGHQIATGSNQGSGPGPVVATVSQDVLLVEAPPPDNYRIEWTFRLRATSADGRQVTGCAKLQALFPGSVTSVSC